jgi:hypothetical protein
LKSLFFTAAIAAMSIALLAAVCLPHSALAQNPFDMGGNGRWHGIMPSPASGAAACDYTIASGARAICIESVKRASTPPRKRKTR